MKHNEEEYQLIEMPWSFDLDQSIEMLCSYCCPAKTEFNGHMIYNDESIDEIFIKVTGKTRKQFKEQKQAYIRSLQQKDEEHIKAIPRLTKKWIKQGHKILKEKYWDEWDRCVPIRLSDLYQGWELGCCLELIEILQKQNDFIKAKEIFDKQGHSGMSAHLMKSMLMSFCDDGKDFVEYLNK